MSYSEPHCITFIYDYMQVKIYIIRYSNELKTYQTHFLRTCVLKSLNNDCDILYHNHIDKDHFRYRYPFIQYKSLNRKAAIVCIQEGVEQIGKLLSKQSFLITTESCQEESNIENLIAKQYNVQLWNNSFKYTIRKWLALNKINYQIYSNTPSLKDKIMMLEKILTGNILSFCSGIGLRLESNLDIVITNLTDTTERKFKNVHMMSFDCEFTANISLPDYIGIGKGASLGYGTIKRMKNNIINEEGEQ